MNSILCDSICLWSYTLDINFLRHLRVICVTPTAITKMAWLFCATNRLDVCLFWTWIGIADRGPALVIGSDHLELLNDDTRQRSYASRVDYLRMSPFLQDYLSSFTWLQNHLFEHWFDFTHSCRLSSIWEVWIGALMTTQRQEKWSQVHIWHSFYV